MVTQLPYKDKAKLGEELAKESIDNRLTRLLMSFKTDELSQEDIDFEIEVVRAEIYAQIYMNDCLIRRRLLSCWRGR